MKITFLFHDRSPWFSGQTLYFIEVMEQLKQQDYDVGYRIESYLHPYAVRLLHDNFNDHHDQLTDVLVVTKQPKTTKLFTNYKKLVLVVDNRKQKPIKCNNIITITHSPLIAKNKNAVFLPRAGYQILTDKQPKISVLTKHLNDLDKFKQLKLTPLMSFIEGYGDRVSKHLVGKTSQYFTFHIKDILSNRVFIHMNPTSTTIPFSVASCILSNVAVFSLSHFVSSMLQTKFSPAKIARCIKDDEFYASLTKKQQQIMSQNVCTFSTYVKKFLEVVGS